MSKSEEYVFTFLAQAGLNDIERSHYVEYIGGTVDGYHAPTNTLIYVDGPTHYAADGTLCLADQLLDNIAKKHGYTVMRIKLPKIDMTQRMHEVIQLSHPDIQAVMKHVKGDGVGSESSKESKPTLKQDQQTGEDGPSSALDKPHAASQHNTVQNIGPISGLHIPLPRSKQLQNGLEEKKTSPHVSSSIPLPRSKQSDGQHASRAITGTKLADNSDAQGQNAQQKPYSKTDAPRKISSWTELFKHN